MNNMLFQIFDLVTTFAMMLVFIRFIAGRLAMGGALIDAIKAADSWIIQTLRAADAPHPNDAQAQLIPNRFVSF